MKKTYCAISLPLILVTCLACLIAQGQAQTTALSFSGQLNEVDQSDFTWGWAFSLANPISVTDIGVYDTNNTTRLGVPGDGLNEAHIITIWTSAGVQVAQGTVPSGTAGTLLNGFRYASLLSPTPLLPGNYVIGAYSQNSADTFAVAATSLSTAAGITFMNDRQGTGSGMPTLSGGGNGVFGPNFRFTNGFLPVPDESSTCMLLLLAIGSLFSLKSCSRKISRQPF